MCRFVGKPRVGVIPRIVLVLPVSTREQVVSNAVFTAQREFFTGLSKAVGDSRAEDRTGQLLRRVEITKCGRL